MDRSELRMALHALGVDSRLYSLSGGVSERVCLEHRAGNWVVSFYERGNERILGKFQAEADACKFMLSELRNEL